MTDNEEDLSEWFLVGELLRSDPSIGSAPYDEDPYNSDPYEEMLGVW